MDRLARRAARGVQVRARLEQHVQDLEVPEPGREHHRRHRLLPAMKNLVASRWLLREMELGTAQRWQVALPPGRGRGRAVFNISVPKTEWRALGEATAYVCARPARARAPGRRDAPVGGARGGDRNSARVRCSAGPARPDAARAAPVKRWRGGGFRRGRTRERRA